MADDNPPSLRARRWTPPPSAGGRSSPRKSYRFVLRLLGIPILAVAGVFIYSGIRDRLVLPDCDSDRAKKSLADVLQQFKYEPTKYAPIKTVSATKDQVVCSAVLPLPDGSSVVADFTFYWQGDTVNMKYSVARKASDDSSATPPLR
ncbi:MAG: hypothetical protein ABSB77_09915 [Xanthobacteraceae bacterium]|jgi:hypothetical protein